LSKHPTKFRSNNLQLPLISLNKNMKKDFLKLQLGTTLPCSLFPPLPLSLSFTNSHIHTYTYTHRHPQTHTHTHTHKHPPTHHSCTLLHTHKHTHVHVHKLRHNHTLTYAQTHQQTLHTHTHVQTITKKHIPSSLYKQIKKYYASQLFFFQKISLFELMCTERIENYLFFLSEFSNSFTESFLLNLNDKYVSRLCAGVYVCI